MPIRASWEGLAARMRAAGPLNWRVEGGEVVTTFEGHRFVCVGAWATALLPDATQDAPSYQTNFNSDGA